MKKYIFFYLPNSNCISIDCRNIEHGNPGLGGTEYMIILIATILSLRGKLNVTLLLEEEGIFHPNLKTVVAGGFEQAYEIACRMKADFFVFRPLPCYFSSVAFSNTQNVKMIPWCHNFLSYQELLFLYRCDKIPYIVSVGKEQSELYLDMKIDDKMIFIYNSLPIITRNHFKQLTKPNDRKNIVTYIGSIVPSKGFHLLAKAWKQVLQAIPDAELYVIGSGSLYFNGAKLGKYSIAEQSYEKSFMKYLIDEKGKILKSVHFCGILGEEKNEILKKTKVGIPNPSGLTETFGLSAVEMQLMGCNIVTKKCPGFLDTVKVGLLYDDDTLLATNIIKALKKPQTDFCEAIEYFEKNFSISKVSECWENLFLNASVFYQKNKSSKISNIYFRHKKLKMTLKRLKSKYRILNILPSIETLLYYRQKI